MMTMNQDLPKNKDINPDWNQSNLFYIFLNELDMDYKESYFGNDYDRMYKVYKLKYMKVRTFINKIASDEEKTTLTDDTVIETELTKLKPGDNDFSSKWNNTIIKTILDVIEKKMIIVDELMSKCGMNILVKDKKPFRPAALGTDDWE